MFGTIYIVCMQEGFYVGLMVSSLMTLPVVATIRLHNDTSESKARAWNQTAMMACAVSVRTFHAITEHLYNSVMVGVSQRPNASERLVQRFSAFR